MVTADGWVTTWWSSHRECAFAVDGQHYHIKALCLSLLGHLAEEKTIPHIWLLYLYYLHEEASPSIALRLQRNPTQGLPWRRLRALGLIRIRTVPTRDR